MKAKTHIPVSYSAVAVAVILSFGSVVSAQQALEILAATGDVAPGTAGARFGDFESPIANRLGDVSFRAVREVASVLTPVPGGVGPVTVAILLRSAAEAARKQLAATRRLEF